MARQPRIEYEGALYHVTSRGNLKQNIFFHDSDRKTYLAILGRIKERYGCILHAYVLMDNHFHLLVETPRANLHRLMQNLNTSYTVFINRKYHRSGHLFQGRYKAIIVEKDVYLLELSRYIHLNPVRAGTVRFPEQHRWSSYGEYVGHRGLGLINTRDTLSHFSGDPAKAVAQYKRFVESGIEGTDSPFMDLRAGVVLGREGFVKEKLEAMVRDKGADRELPALKRLRTKASIAQAIKAVAGHYGLDPDDLRRRSRRFSAQRKVAIYVAKIWSGQRNSSIAVHFGITTQAVTNVLTEMEKELEQSAGMREEIEGITGKM
jgi:REP element-mobilizing transposase RayT